VAALIVVDQAVVQPLLVRLDRFAPVINLAGRQRMLSQRLTKAVLIIDRAESEEAARTGRQELRTTLEQWSAAHTSLQSADTRQGAARISSPTIQTRWAQLEPHYHAMASAAQAVIDSHNDLPNDSQKSAVDTIVTHEAPFLNTMDQIVKLLENEANHEVQRLRELALGIAATIIGLIVGLGWFVVRPATRTIRAQVDELEIRVEERTAALATALDGLKQEVLEREKVESKNQRLAAQLAHADRVESIGHLAVGLAHELNHPLGTIANYAEACDVLLKRDEEIPHGKLTKFVLQIRDASLRAGQIVRRMRNFVQPNASETVETDLRTLIGDVIDLCRPEVEQNQVVLTTQLGSQPLRVHVDVIQIQQVLVNLVQNAIQAMTNTPTHKRKILIRTEIVADQIRIDVVDSGPGFDAADAERIFEPFTSTKSEGLGVGLSICRSLIENHQGIIWAKSAPPDGALVSFTLPIFSPHDSPSSLQTHSLCC
jgi:C4-dicarboxylate-specific signal transduction histidine kinase